MTTETMAKIWHIIWGVASVLFATTVLLILGGIWMPKDKYGNDTVLADNLQSTAALCFVLTAISILGIIFFGIELMNRRADEERQRKWAEREARTDG